uniref:Uncharacterized protein n=1 Tax=Parascaris univalens TaxID=6257 RepID=A0A914ZSG9_PARUN
MSLKVLHLSLIMLSFLCMKGVTLQGVFAFDGFINFCIISFASVAILSFLKECISRAVDIYGILLLCTLQLFLFLQKSYDSGFVNVHFSAHFIVSHSCFVSCR